MRLLGEAEVCGRCGSDEALLSETSFSYEVWCSDAVITAPVICLSCGWQSSSQDKGDSASS